MKVDDVIADLFDLPDSPKPLQDEESCYAVVEYLSTFCRRRSSSWFNKAECGAFQRAIEKLKERKSCDNIVWLPKYGCALNKSTDGCMPGEVAVNLIALDLHQFQTTSKVSSNNSFNYVDTAFATGYQLLAIGICNEDELPAHEEAFQRLLSSAQSRSGDERSARGGKQGHQRTPAFIHALYRQVFTKVEELPRGGFTDVGLHTGGEPRSTSGSLVFSALNQALVDHEDQHGISSDSLFKKILCYFGLFLSRAIINDEHAPKAKTPKSNAPKRDLGQAFHAMIIDENTPKAEIPQSNAPKHVFEQAFHIIKISTLRAAAASDEGIDMSLFVKCSKNLCRDIMDLSSQASAKYSEQFCLPKVGAEIRGSYQNFSFNIHRPYSPAKCNSLSESRIYKNESENLVWHNFPVSNGLRDIHDWVKNSATTARRDTFLSFLVLRKVERLMWNYAKKIPSMEYSELKMLVGIIDQYRTVLFKCINQISSLSFAQLRSRELLVTWVVRLYTSRMQGFGVPLNYKRLSYLVLSTRQEWEAAKQVAVYLHNYGIDKPIFSLKDEAPTFNLGRVVANSSHKMLKIWEEEEIDANSRMEHRWQAVLKQKEEAQELRHEIADLEGKRYKANQKIASKLEDLEEHRRQQRLHEYCKEGMRWDTEVQYDRREHQICIDQIANLQNRVAKLRVMVNNIDLELHHKNEALRTALKSPPPVIQPLPKDKDRAMPIIFFLYMPRVFKLLSRLSFTAQQLLIPTPWNRNEAERRDIARLISRQAGAIGQLSLKDHYNKYSSREGSDSHLFLRSIQNSDSIPEPRNIGNSNVDHIRNKNDGIWYPDQLQPRMAWYGGPKSFDRAPNDSEIDPFVDIDHFKLVDHFTDQFPVDTHLQWTIMQPEENHGSSDRIRGNLAYARQNQRPDWLSNTGWLNFANLRAYPNSQLRNILVAIQDRQLPFNKFNVRMLIDQACFQLGELSVFGPSAILEWKRDLDNVEFCRDSYTILLEFYNGMKSTPKNYKCVKLLGGLCNFLSEWEPSCRMVARKLAASVNEWAEDMGKDIDDKDPTAVPEIRAKQVVLYQNAIYVLVGGALDGCDVEMLIEMLIKSRNLFTGDNLRYEIERNETEILYKLVERVDDVMLSVANDPIIITRALRKFFPRCPLNLEWEKWAANDNLGHSTSCFKARGNDGHAYSINLFTGTVLINGVPPSRLPASVLRHKLYMRSFGVRQFEVVQKEGFFESRRPTFGRFYRFSLGSSLKIFELKEDGSEMLELLDISSWSNNIPPRLTKMHSHWLYRDRNLIILRGISFENRNISYLIECERPYHDFFESGIAKVNGHVKCVNEHQDARDQLQLLLKHKHTMDTLVLHKSPVLNILSKFEPKEFIHSIIEPGENELKFYFSRYKLTFKLHANSVLKCHEIAGYQLLARQQIDDTFRGFSRYLLLGKCDGVGPKLIVVPVGQVERKSIGAVNINVPEDCDAELMWYRYEFHRRFKYIETKQLVALHMATASILPDILLGVTGEERAVAVMRQCFVNRPLDEREMSNLKTIKQLSKGRSPTLSLLCQNNIKMSHQLSFLYSTVTSSGGFTENQCFEGSAYLSNVESGKLGVRCYLTKQEEARVIGIYSKRPKLAPRFNHTQTLLPSPVADDMLDSLEAELDKCRSSSTIKCTNQMPNDSFPLDITPSSNLEAAMLNELKKSWEAHHNSSSCSSKQTTADIEALTMTLPLIKIRARDLRYKVEKYALDALNKRPLDCSHWHDDAHEMLRTVGIVPSATTSDLAKISFTPSLIQDFNPMLNQDARQTLVKSIITWLRLCVYEDKITRLLSLCDVGTVEDVMKELDTKTIWVSNDYPYWLVFEVENAIMIRQEQYKVAKHLIHNPGHILQLNMGLGKTRVILPMLVMYFSLKNGVNGHYSREKITRLHFLSALINEAYNYLQNHLTASILGVNIYLMPFCRDVQLNTNSINMIKNVLNDCRVNGGALVVAPEHRLSLELKATELILSGDKETATLVEKLIRADIWRDILDECDELLSHRRQLIYAIGNPIPLPGRDNRFRSVQGLCHMLAQHVDVKEYLHANQESCQMAMKSCEQWPEIQFFEGNSLDLMLGGTNNDGLLTKLVDTIVSDPPNGLRWMSDHPSSHEMKKAIIERDYNATTLEKLSADHISDILSLRGLLSGGVLRHCLVKRHRVNYGIARPGKRRVAVPFRFADTPDERSEFAHPDCAIAFTVLAYYHDGLLEKEMLLALEALMEMGPEAQKSYYNKWLDISSDKMKELGPDVAESIDCVRKIDLTNEVQMKSLYHVFSKNMFTIDFYLNCCVFPIETDQFGTRLTANSWNIAQNPSNSIVGFSGTNDNWRILPLQVTQYFASHHADSDPILKTLDGTNGEMLETIMANTILVEQLPRDVDHFKSLLKILETSINENGSFHALIDCGALLAGCDLHNFSIEVLSYLPSSEFDGVLFFESNEFKDWVVLERSGRILLKGISPVTEQRAFAIFDEPRCRGTDLKLITKAIALLTLAPNVCKDKLMQSAGRLRKLGQGQKLVMVGGSDVFTKLNEFRKSSNSKPFSFSASAEEILAWSMKNTVESTAAGLFNWSNQAFFFATTFGKDPLFRLTDEVLGLDDLYGKSFHKQSITHSTDTALRYHLGRTGGEKAVSSCMEDIIAETLSRVNEYGSDFSYSVRGCDEECERELEMEVEEEEEIQVELPAVNPMSETRWEFQALFRCKCPTELPIPVYRLPDFVKKFIRCRGSSSVSWAKDIYTTSNFASTIAFSGNSSSLLHLRMINFMLYFPNKSLLLVSEYEANHVLPLFWSARPYSNHHLMHLSLVRRSLDNSERVLLRCSVSKLPASMGQLFAGQTLSADNIIKEESMSSLQLFAGEATYATEARKEALKAILRQCFDHNFCPLAEARRFVEIRGNDKLFPCSILENICEQLICEREFPTVAETVACEE